MGCTYQNCSFSRGTDADAIPIKTVVSAIGLLSGESTKTVAFELVPVYVPMQVKKSCLSGAFNVVAATVTEPIKVAEAGFADLVSDLTPASDLAADLIPLEDLSRDAVELP